ncbi:MAG: MlaE family ABC transporter permease [Spirochaetaceae bacterium]
MLTHLGKSVLDGFDNFLYGAGFFFQALRSSISFLRERKIGSRVLTMQILFTGVEALGVIALISVSLGMVIIIQGISILPQFGQGELIYTILITVITRELGPILCAFIVIARSATAIATELGQMVVSHQIEAYVATGVNPVRYLVAPRFIGVTLSVVFLNLYFNFFGLVGSYVLTQFFEPISAAEYFTNLLIHLKTTDIISSLVKSLVFGLIISFTATFNGLKVQHSSTEVPQVVIKAVVQGFTLCIISDALITMVYYL